MKHLLLDYLAKLGALRLMLVITGLIVIVINPPPGTPASFETWGFIYTVLLPVLAPMVFMVLMLDALMSRVFMGDTEDRLLKQRFKTIIVTHLLIAAGLVVAWLPYLLALGRP